MDAATTRTRSALYGKYCARGAATRVNADINWINSGLLLALRKSFDGARHAGFGRALATTGSLYRTARCLHPGLSV